MNMLITPSDVVYENRSKHVDYFLKQYAPLGSVLPLFSNAKNSKKLEVIASCTLFKHRNYYFVLTAAHCVKHGKPTLIHPLVLPNSPDLESKSLLEIKEWQLIEVNNIDFAMAEISSDDVRQLECSDQSFFSNRSHRQKQFDDDSHFIVSGFACKKNDVVKLRINQTIEHYASAVQCCTNSAVKNLHKSKPALLSSPETHIYCGYTLNEIHEEGKQSGRHFNPKGISGGALVYINQGKALMLDRAPYFYLAGIIIELQQKIKSPSGEMQDILIATRLDVLLPNIDDYIDKKYI